MESDKTDPTVLHPEPKTADEARKIIEDVRFQNGMLGDEGNAELNKLSPDWRRRFAGIPRAARENLARFTKL